MKPSAITYGHINFELSPFLTCARIASPTFKSVQDMPQPVSHLTLNLFSIGQKHRYEKHDAHFFWHKCQTSHVAESRLSTKISLASDSHCLTTLDRTSRKYVIKCKKRSGNTLFYFIKFKMRYELQFSLNLQKC